MPEAKFFGYIKSDLIYYYYGERRLFAGAKGFARGYAVRFD